MVFVNLFYRALILCMPLWNRIDVGRLLQSRRKATSFPSGQPKGWPEVTERWLLRSQCCMDISLCFYCIIALEERPFRNPQSCCRLTGGIGMSPYFRLCRSRPALLWLTLFVGRLLQSRHKATYFPSGQPKGRPEVIECWLLRSQCCVLDRFWVTIKGGVPLQIHLHLFV